MCIKILENYCKTHEITINALKSYFIIFGKISKISEADRQIILNGVILIVVLYILYLGVWPCYNLSNKMHLEERKSKFSKAVYGLGSKSLTSRLIPPPIKAFQIKIYAIPIITDYVIRT